MHLPGYQWEISNFGFFLDWNEKQENKEDMQVWEDNWDDDDVEDDFSQQLRYPLDFVMIIYIKSLGYLFLLL